MGNSGARKFFFQFILLPFPFCHRKKNIRLKSYNVFRIKKHFPIPSVSQSTAKNDKWEKKIHKLKKIVYFEISHKTCLPFLEIQPYSYVSWKSDLVLPDCS